jgi:hypothetical protein
MSRFEKKEKKMKSLIALLLLVLCSSSFAQVVIGPPRTNNGKGQVSEPGVRFTENLVNHYNLRGILGKDPETRESRRYPAEIFADILRSISAGSGRNANEVEVTGVLSSGVSSQVSLGSLSLGSFLLRQLGISGESVGIRNEVTLQISAKVTPANGPQFAIELDPIYVRQTLYEGNVVCADIRSGRFPFKGIALSFGQSRTSADNTEVVKYRMYSAAKEALENAIKLKLYGDGPVLSPAMGKGSRSASSLFLSRSSDEREITLLPEFSARKGDRVQVPITYWGDTEDSMTSLYATVTAVGSDGVVIRIIDTEFRKHYVLDSVRPIIVIPAKR